MTRKIIAQNRKARHEYFIDEVMEAGIALTGTEVKALRAGRASIGESYATEIRGEMYWTGANIQEYEKGNRFNHPPVRNRKLLLKKREINKILGKLKTKGVTVIPLAVYFNEGGRAKLELGLARGKKQHDKRDAIKQRDWDRRKSRVLRGDD
ncbi:MAG: SsrA-binding protein SmpB [Alphaproteobacteria bacterium]|jgi:SsrA-binding protein|nr:SsrA-binding protein SmpB [Alphaproteobacteria bacterium]MDG1414920.1 SsrA-binding protein SmpB [Alphaproteobacteria bacterium]